MFSANDRISVRQLKILVILNLFSTTSLILPRMAAEAAGRDGWIAVILGTILALLYVLIIMHLAYKFPQKTLIEYSQTLLGKVLTFIIGFIFIAKLILSAAFGLRLFSELIKEVLLDNTPIEVIIMSMLLVVVYVARKGYECRARVAEILIWIIFIPIILVLIFALPQVNFSNILPVFVNEPKDILMGGYIISLTYSAVDLLLLAIPYTDRPRETRKPVIKAVLLVGIFNIILCIITFGLFGELGTRRQIWPVMTIMQVVEIPGSLLERQDGLMIAFWILSIFAVINAYVFFISIITQKLFKLKEQNFLVLPFLPVIFLLALIPNNVVEIYEYTKNLMSYMGVFLLVIIPVILIGLAKKRKIGEA
ncbi:spore germination protein [Natranaerovirga hydrolytica]|uniref:Spore germination protein n=1 Tax=Natranaerovirga hydrolytica TaxID=680378 RepID=A0A4R1MRT9_9FIRM|nr:endospore germination permease [Natranaerovirga hydrolytica]TCK93289.1 spore germination protein [Natranaerovirga hydrolytica]